MQFQLPVAPLALIRILAELYKSGSIEAIVEQLRADQILSSIACMFLRGRSILGRESNI